MTIEFRAAAGRPTLRIERHYPHPIAAVWRAVTTPEHLKVWFPSPVEIDLRVGGALRFSAFEGEDGAGTVEAVDPPRLLAFSWGGDRLRFELAPAEGGTLFTLIHTFDDRAGAPSFATGWEECLVWLGHLLAGDPMPPERDGTARHEELLTAFGLDRPAINVDGDRWMVRYERQLTCPAEVAWNLWFGIDQVTGEQRRAPAVGEPFRPYGAPDLVIGTMTEVDQPRVLAFDATPEEPGERVRVELGEGTGHGARLVLTATGADPADRDAAVAQWGAAVDHLAGEGARRAIHDLRERAATPPGPA